MVGLKLALFHTDFLVNIILLIGRIVNRNLSHPCRLGGRFLRHVRWVCDGFLRVSQRVLMRRVQSVASPTE
jgi:hypothetical protein